MGSPLPFCQHNVRSNHTPSKLESRRILVKTESLEVEDEAELSSTGHMTITDIVQRMDKTLGEDWYPEKDKESEPVDALHERSKAIIEAYEILENDSEELSRIYKEVRRIIQKIDQDLELSYMWEVNPKRNPIKALKERIDYFI